MGAQLPSRLGGHIAAVAALASVVAASLASVVAALAPAVAAALASDAAWGRTMWEPKMSLAAAVAGTKAAVGSEADRCYRYHHLKLPGLRVALMTSLDKGDRFSC